MSVWDDMARDAGYRGDEAQQVAAMLEQEEREKAEHREAERREVEGDHPFPLDGMHPGGWD